MNGEGRVGRRPSRLWSFGDDGRWLDGRTLLGRLAAQGQPRCLRAEKAASGERGGIWSQLCDEAMMSIDQTAAAAIVVRALHRDDWAGVVPLPTPGKASFSPKPSFHRSRTAWRGR
jgi:hypothetical protein